ncbi:MAG TPA: HAMP domain-containing sensor histidine kinase [Longimicrobiales bacterium]
MSSETTSPPGDEATQATGANGGDYGSAAERRHLRLRRLTDAARAFTYAARRDDVARLAASQAAALLDAPRAVLALEDEEGRLRVEAAHGLSAAEIASLHDRQGELMVASLHHGLPRDPGGRFLGVPLVARGRVIGLLVVLGPPGEPFGQEEEWALSALADHAAAALELARLDGDLRERLEQQIEGVEQLDARRQRAVATLAHDLRAPLNAIVAFTEGLESQIFGPLSERQHDAVHRIRVSAAHILSLSADLLDAALLNAGATMVQVARVRCADVVAEATLIVRPQALARGQTLDVEPVPLTLFVEADANRLRQVLVNLVDNAVKYTPSGGRIHVSVSATATTPADAASPAPAPRDAAAWAVVTISDTGPGIPPDQQEAIFEPYHRAGDAMDVAGAGLGLSIARGLVRRMSGDLTVTSTPGQGATFEVRLRVAAEEDGGGEGTAGADAEGTAGSEAEVWEG